MSVWNSRRSPAFQLLADLEKVAGPDVCRAFMSAVGGTRIMIPRHRPRPGLASRLVCALGGEEAARPIIARLIALGHGNQTLELPLGERGAQYQRMMALREAIAAGTESTSELALRFGVSERTVHANRAKLGYSNPAGCQERCERNHPAARRRKAIVREIQETPDLDTRKIEALAQKYYCSVRLIHSVHREVGRQERIEPPRHPPSKD